MNEPLKAVSNVIELKPDKFYLLVFTGSNLNHKNLAGLGELLDAEGVRGISIALTDKQSLEVIEAPKENT